MSAVADGLIRRGLVLENERQRGRLDRLPTFDVGKILAAKGGRESAGAEATFQAASTAGAG